MLYELRKVKRQFGDRTVLDIDFLSFAERKIYALIGPNGAGKTTLLNSLALLDQPTSGEICFRGERIRYERKEMTRLRKHIVLVDQTPILFTGTVRSNIEFGLKMRGVPKFERRIKVMSALERVGMSDFADSGTKGLSGGEVKRVALARALAVEPNVLLCDEPTANVDQKHQEIILKILAHANSNWNTTVVFSTHYLSQSRRLADQTILLQNGRVSAEGGENSYPVSIVNRDGGRLVLKLAADCHLNLASVGSGTVRDGQLRVQLIPEKIRLEPVSGDERRPCTGRVVNIAIEGSTVRVTVDMGIILTAALSLHEYRKQQPLVGQAVRVEFPEGAAFIC